MRTRRDGSATHDHAATQPKPTTREASRPNFVAVENENGGARRPRHRCYGISQSKTLRIPTTTSARNRKTVARRSARATLLVCREERRRSGFPSGPFSFSLTSRTSLPLASLDVDEVRCAPDGMEVPRARTQHLKHIALQKQYQYPDLLLWKTRMAGPEGPAIVARKSASPRLSESQQPLARATEKLLQDAVPVLRSSCYVRNVGGPDFHPDRFRFHSHLAPPSPSPHLMWTKSGAHPTGWKCHARLRSSSNVIAISYKAVPQIRTCG